MKTEDIMHDLVNTNSAGYFYNNNCRINYSSMSGFYCKDFKNGKMNTYNVTAEQAQKKIEESITL